MGIQNFNNLSDLSRYLDHKLSDFPSKTGLSKEGIQDVANLIEVVQKNFELLKAENRPEVLSNFLKVTTKIKDLTKGIRTDPLLDRTVIKKAIKQVAGILEKISGKETVESKSFIDLSAFVATAQGEDIAKLRQEFALLDRDYSKVDDERGEIDKNTKLFFALYVAIMEGRDENARFILDETPLNLKGGKYVHKDGVNYGHVLNAALDSKNWDLLVKIMSRPDMIEPDLLTFHLEQLFKNQQWQQLVEGITILAQKHTLKGLEGKIPARLNAIYLSACDNGQLHVVRALIDNNLVVDPSKQNWSGLMRAATRGHWDVVDYLIGKDKVGILKGTREKSRPGKVHVGARNLISQKIAQDPGALALSRPNLFEFMIRFGQQQINLNKCLFEAVAQKNDDIIEKILKVSDLKLSGEEIATLRRALRGKTSLLVLVQNKAK